MSGKVALLQMIATVGGSAVSERGISAWVFGEAGEAIGLSLGYDSRWEVGRSG